MRLITGVHLYLAARHNELAADTRLQLRGSLTRTATRIGPDLLVRNVRARHVDQWLAGLTGSAGTIRNELSAFRNFCKWCVMRGHMRVDPTLGIKGPRQPRPLPREITDDEIVKLLAVLPNPRAEVIVMLGLAQGLRRGAISSQLREDIDLSGRMMVVTRTKGGEKLWLPLTTDTYDAIRAYYREVPDSTGPLIRSETRPWRGITPHHVTALVNAWMSEAGVKLHPFDGKSPHALRHRRAGSLLDDGADVREVQALLGHASLQSTLVYLRRHHADGKLRELMDRRSFREAS